MCALNQEVKQCVDKLRAGSCKADCVARLEQLVKIVAAHSVSEFKEVKAAESKLGFAVLSSNAVWIKAVPDFWLIVLGTASGQEAEERTVVQARYVMTVSLYDALRVALHRTRNPVQPFPPPSEVSVGDVRAPVLYYIAGWLFDCIRRDPVSIAGVWQL